MTGLEAHSHGLKEYKAGFELPVSETLPKQIRNARYQTKLIGQSHMYSERCIKALIKCYCVITSVFKEQLKSIL